MDKQIIITQIKEIIEEQLETKIQNPDDIINIDSFTMMLVITYADIELGIKLNMEVLDFDEFKTLNTLADLICSQEK